MDEWGFMDMGFIGSQFTWHKHYARYTVWERLDRVVAMNYWFAKFLDTKIHHIDVTTSNHKPLWIVLEGMECRQQQPFRSEQMWMTEQGSSDTIEAVWRNGEDEPWTIKLLEKVDKCGSELSKWTKSSFVNVCNELVKKRKLLVQAERHAIRGGDATWMRNLEREINRMMDKEAKIWSQRVWVSWLKDGDRITKFFSYKSFVKEA